MPTISFNGLAFLTLLREASNGSIKPTAPQGEDIPFYTSHLPTLDNVVGVRVKT